MLFQLAQSLSNFSAIDGSSISTSLSVYQLSVSVTQWQWYTTPPLNHLTLRVWHGHCRQRNMSYIQIRISRLRNLLSKCPKP